MEQILEALRPQAERLSVGAWVALGFTCCPLQERAFLISHPCLEPPVRQGRYVLPAGASEEAIRQAVEAAGCQFNLATWWPAYRILLAREWGRLALLPEPLVGPGDLLADLDGTILRRWTEEDASPRPAPWLPRLLAHGAVRAICTNQGGIAWALAGGRPGKRYPAWPEVLARIRAGMQWTGARWAFVALHHPRAPVPSPTDPVFQERARAIHLPEPFWDLEAPWVEWEVPEGRIRASWDPGWRKPAPGMLLAAMEVLGLPPESLIFVGDEEADRCAAAAAGLAFQDIDIDIRER